MKPISISFRQIDYVVAVAESGSTAAAARMVNVSQPSVSLAIARVEELLGQHLFIRAAGQGMELTAFGRRKLGELRGLRAQARATLCSPEVDGAFQAELDFGVFSTLGPCYAPQLLRRFKQEVPQALVRVHEGDLQSLCSWLETGHIDLALIYDFGLPRELEVTPIMDVRPYGLVAEDHRLARRDSVALADLLQDPLILINLPQSRGYFLSLIQMQDVTARITMETGSMEMLRSMVANGLGVGLLATELPYRTTYDGRKVVHLPIQGKAPAHRVALAREARLPQTWLSKKFEAFAQELTLPL